MGVGRRRVENRADVECLGGIAAGTTRRERSICQPVAEIASALVGSRHRRNVAQGLPDPGRLVVTENECLVFLDGAAEECTKLISLKARLRRGWPRGEVVSRVQYVVADKFKQPTVDLIGAGLDHNVHGCSTAA